MLVIILLIQITSVTKYSRTNRLKQEPRLQYNVRWKLLQSVHCTDVNTYIRHIRHKMCDNCTLIAIYWRTLKYTMRKNVARNCNKNISRKKLLFYRDPRCISIIPSPLCRRSISLRSHDSKKHKNKRRCKPNSTFIHYCTGTKKHRRPWSEAILKGRLHRMDFGVKCSITNEVWGSYFQPFTGQSWYNFRPKSPLRINKDP